MAEPKRLMAMGATEEDYNKASSKFVESPIPLTEDNLKKTFQMEVLGKNIDWHETGKSYDFTVEVAENGINQGKVQVISGGALPNSIFSSKRYYRALSGKDMPMQKGGDGKLHPNPDPGDIMDKRAIGIWQVTIDSRGMEEGGKGTIYPKLIDIVPLVSAPGKTDKAGTPV